MKPIASLLPLFLLVLFNSVAAQTPRILTVVDAERAFARHAKETTIKQAFLAYMDTASLIVNGEKQIVAGRAHFLAGPDGPGWLRWAPEFAASSADGTFGFTTGPYDFRANRTTDTILDQGEFATVWRRTAGNEWKFVIDMGTPYKLPNQMPARQEVVPPDLTEAAANGKSYLDAEADFAQQFAKAKGRAYRQHLADRFRLLRLGAYPLTPETIDYSKLEAQPDLTFEVTGHAVAASGDLAVVYGYAVPQKGDGITQKDAFMRVWRREGKKWKLALEVLRF
jgi:ketosteroid isomerase-like protein